MAFVFSIKDTYRQAVEAATGGKNTVMYDDKGNPSVMVAIPRFNMSDVIAGAPTTTHPAFIVNGVVKDVIYVSKYQNIVHDSRAYSAAFQDPATYTTFDQALTYCKNKGAGWHLMTNAEWTAIALWCKQNGYMPRGNNNYGSDISMPHEKGKETFYDTGASKTGRIATGSGPKSWAHDNTNEGIFDLNGNVWEWTGGMRINGGEIQVLADNNAADNMQDQSVGSALWKAIDAVSGAYVAPGTAGTLKYNMSVADGSGVPKIATTITGQSDGTKNGGTTFETMAVEAGITVPAIAKALALAPVDAAHGGDYIYVNNNGERLPLRGGNWSNGANAGVFDLNLQAPRSNSDSNIGFRSAYVG